MKAWWMDTETIWAAQTLSEATESYWEETGCSVNAYEVYPVTDAELDRPMPEMDENEQLTGKTTTLRRYLNEMTESGFLACTP